jgi:alpha-tubulin suppressor-like RCC1 family protein
MPDGTAQCWGRNEMGQVGDGTTWLRLGPVPVRGLSHVAQVAAGRDSACARLDDGTVWCWGSNDAGQLGDDTQGHRAVPGRVPGVTGAVDLVAGMLHTCARHRDGTLTCWGWNNHGQCGNGETSDTAKPSRVVGLERIVQVAATWTHTCALRDDGTVHCWGQGWRGVLGDGMQASHSAPVQVKWTFEQRASVGLPAGVHVDSIAVSYSHTCAVLSDHSVRCWGDNSLGQVTGAGKAVDAAEAIPVPRRVAQITSAAGVSLEMFRSAARLTDGRIVLWGPHTAVEDQPQIRPVDDFIMRFGIVCGRRGDTATCADRDGNKISIAKATQIALDHAHACALLADHSVACAGANSRGQLGDGTFTDRWAFAPVAGIRDAVEIAVGTEHSCARHGDGGVSCWGEQDAIGIDIGDHAGTPVRLPGLGGVVQLAAGGSATCARTGAGAVYCWGRYGLGQGDPASSATPVLVPWLAGAKAFALGLSHSCVLLGDGTPACWGGNGDGQLGDGTMTDRDQATPVRW